MTVNLSALAGAGQQFLDANGNPLTGGKLYSYEAGTTTPQVTYTTAAGNVPHANPIILDSAGRVPGGQIWLSIGLSYKFVLTSSTDTSIGAWDNITGIAADASDLSYTPAVTSLLNNVATDTAFALNAITNEETGSSVVGFIQAGAGSIATTVAAKLRETVSVKDFGAVGDGVANDTAAIQNAELNIPVYAPPGTYLASGIASPASLIGKQYGYGQIKTADGNKSAPNFAIVSSAPTSSGNADSINTAFNGDLSGCQFPVAQFVSGAATLGQPTTGYLYTPEAMPHYTFLFNSSGWNESLSGNGGRTGVAAYRTRVFQAGQGDAVCYNGSVFVTGTRAGSTNFLANPAGVLFNGDMQAGADGIYLNPYETICLDEGYDVACVGLVNNFERTNATGAKSAIWNGYRAQNIGSATCDALISATGKWVTGLDLVMSALDFGATKAAISLKADDRIYLNNAANASGNLDAGWRTTVFNGDYIEYNNAISAISFVRGGSSKFQIASSTVTVANAELAVNVGYGSNSIIRARQLGFNLPTGTLNGDAFNTATVTLDKLAGYVGYLATRLHASTPGGHALIGN